MKRPALTLGPLFMHWTPEKRRDFYARIADEAPVDEVYWGETVCAKREPFWAEGEAEIIERLERGGKRVIRSSLALLTSARERAALSRAAAEGRLIEANDVSAIQALDGKPFIVGPFINVMNEGTLSTLASLGAVRVVFASEITGRAITLLAAQRPEVEKEVQIFGRQPLAVSMRCYHARAHGRDKDHCRFACGLDPDGLAVDTIAGQPILTVNGTQTLSRGYVLLFEEAGEMAAAGVTHFRLAPQDCDMVAVARLARAVLDGKTAPEEAEKALLAHVPAGTAFVNGFYHGREGKAQQKRA